MDPDRRVALSRTQDSIKPGVRELKHRVSLQSRLCWLIQQASNDDSVPVQFGMTSGTTGYTGTNCAAFSSNG